MSFVSFRQGMSAGVVDSNCLVGAREMRFATFHFQNLQIGLGLATAHMSVFS